MAAPVRPTNLQDDLESLRKQDYFNTEKVLEKCEELEKQNPEKAKAYRNKVVNARIYANDIHFSVFQKDVYLERVWLNTGTDWTVLALSGAGAVVGGAGTKTALSATSAGVTGAKKSFEENIYMKKTMEAILDHMVAKREKVLAKIQDGLRRSIEEYPLIQALRDLEEYYNAGTIPAALVEISKKAGEGLKEAETIKEREKREEKI